MATASTPFVSDLHASIGNTEQTSGLREFPPASTSGPTSISATTPLKSKSPENSINRRVNASTATLPLSGPGNQSGEHPFQTFQEINPLDTNDSQPRLEEHYPSYDPRGQQSPSPTPAPVFPSARFPSPPQDPPRNQDLIFTKELYYSEHKFHAFLHSFSLYTDLILRQLYFNIHLRLPSHYFSRVAMIYQNAELTKPDVEAMISDARRGGDGYRPWAMGGGHIAMERKIRAQKTYEKIKKSWNALIESLLREWETLNVVSVLLLSAILSILQIDAASSYSVTRYTAFASLVCALMSLLYGCLFIARFLSMKDTTRSVRWASEWADEASRGNVSILWNVWVMLALPTTFLCWAIVLFVACIMSFMWHSALQAPDSNSSSSSSSSSPSPSPISLQTGRAFCIVITIILFIGLLYLALIIRTFKTWGTRVRVWTEDYNQEIDHELGRRRSMTSFPVGDGDRNDNGNSMQREGTEEEGGNDIDSIRAAGVDARGNASFVGFGLREGEEQRQVPKQSQRGANDDDVSNTPTAQRHSTLDMRIQS